MDEIPNPDREIKRAIALIFKSLNRTENPRSSYDITLNGKTFSSDYPLTYEEMLRDGLDRQKIVIKMAKKALDDQKKLIPHFVQDLRLNEDDEDFLEWPYPNPWGFLGVFGLKDPEPDKIVGEPYEVSPDQKGVPLSKDNHFVKSNLE